MLAEAPEYHERLAGPCIGLSWCAHDCDWEYVDAASATWSFVELTSGEELVEEGLHMHHCVASYANRCGYGYSAIVSLRRDGVRQVTIEISPAAMKLVQVRGAHNEHPTQEARAAIVQWRNQVLDKAQRNRLRPG